MATDCKVLTYNKGLWRKQTERAQERDAKREIAEEREDIILFKQLSMVV